MLEYAAVRLLVAFGWVATGFWFDLGVTLEWGEVRLLRRLGGGEDRPIRPLGKIVLTRGLRRLLDYLAPTALLTDEEKRHGLPHASRPCSAAPPFLELSPEARPAA